MKLTIIAITCIILFSLYLFYPYLQYDNNINTNEHNDMMISFFVEYPDKELDKVNLIDFPTKLYVAANDLGEFNRIKSSIKNKHVKEIIYWPVLNDNEGYWLSPFTDRKALLRVMDETKNSTILWDAELPKKRIHILTRLIGFLKNKKDINNYFKSHEKTVYTAEYFPHSRFLGFLGLSFNPNKFGNKKIKMIYSSMHNYNEYIVRREINYGVKEYGDNFLAGFGTLAVGVKGNEPLIRPEILDRDLRIAKELGVKEVVIYRLGGLNAEYLKIIKKYNKNSM